MSPFEILELNQVGTADRALIPMHYTFVARRPGELPT